jgi:hypothetical protein
VRHNPVQRKGGRTRTGKIGVGVDFIIDTRATQGLLYTHTEKIAIGSCKAVIFVSDAKQLNAELNPIFHLLALGAHHILHVRRVRV